MTQFNRPIPRPQLYIDVDGVLFGVYDGHMQLRPNVVGFLRWCLQHFRCHWLTVWSEEHLAALFSHIYAGDLMTKITWTLWHDQPDGSDKAAAIALGDHWWWIEDKIKDGERDYLIRHDMLDRYIEVNEMGRDELEIIQQRLEQKLELYRSAYS